MSSPTRDRHPEMAGVDAAEHRILPPDWEVDELDIGVSLQLDERLNNCVYREFWVDFAAANLSHAVRMIKSHPDTPLLYFGYLPLEYSDLDHQLDCEVTWPLGRRGALSAIKARQTYEDYRFEHTLMTPVLVLRNRYLGGWRFRPELTICGDDETDLLRSWTFVAKKIRRILAREEQPNTGADV